jgi:hypothetical protein
MGPVRTAFHDAVARFGGFRHCLGERFLLVEQAEFAGPPLTPLSRCNRRKPFDKEGSLESQRQDRLTTRGVNRNVTTPARGAFTRWLRIDRSIRRWAMQHNLRKIRSHSATLVSLRVMSARRRTTLAFRCFRLGDAASTTRDGEPRAPSHAKRGASLRSRWPARGCKHCNAHLAKALQRFGSDSSRGLQVRTRERVDCWVSPYSMSPGHLTVTPRARRTSEQRATCSPLGRRPSRSARADSLRSPWSLGNPPREGRDPGEDRGVFRPFDHGTHARVRREDACEVSLVDFFHVVVFGS